jgi:hypothetical protein
LRQSVVYGSLDESGSLTSPTPFFTMAVLVTAQPEALRNIVRRAALRSGKHLKRRRKRASELKWSNASQRIRSTVLSQLAEADVEIFTLTVRKEGRRITDTPLNYAVLACELLQLCWSAYPDMALAVDKHFTPPAQRAVVDTFIHRHWPKHGVLTLAHVNSQSNPLVQLADFAAGSVYDWHKQGDASYRLLESRIGAELVESWQHVKHRWLREVK